MPPKILPENHKKDELVAMAAKKLSMETSKVNRLTKPQICDLLNSNPKVTTKVASSKVASSKVASSKVASKVTSPKATKKVATPVKKKLTGIEMCKQKYDECQSQKASSPTKVKKPATKKPTKTSSPPVSAKISPKPTLSKPPKATIKVSVTDKTKPCIERSALTLKEHQIRVVNHMRKHRGLIVCHDMGSGKTLTAVAASQCFLEDNPTGNVIVVTPVSLQNNFKKEMGAYGVDPDEDNRYEFYTFQGFATAYNKKVCGKKTMLIIDEAHNLRSVLPSEKAIARKKALAEIDERKEPIIRADVAIRCAESAGKVLLLTGTAVYNNPLDIVNLVAMVKGIKPPTKNAFQKILDSPTEFRNFFKCVLSFYKASESSDYPTVKEHYVEIEMTPSYLRSYQAVEMQSHHLFSESNPWRFLTGVRQASNALEECIKCEWILEKAKTGIKILIYSAFISYGIKQVQELFVSNKIKFLEITGSMSKSKRSAAVEDFNNGVVNVLFITKAGGEGLDLKGTRAVIFLESSWNRPNEEQVIGRARRYKSHSHLPPSERKVDVYHLLMVKPKKLVDPDKWIKTKKDGIKEYPSADSMLKQMVDEKDKTAKQFLARVYPLTIDQSKC